MPLVSELELPAFDYTDPELKGPRFHAKMAELAQQNWLASTPLGFFTLDRDSSAFFLRSKAAIFPGLKMAEMFEIPEGPLLEQIRRNILNVNGADHGRLRNLVNPAFTPRAADRWRPAIDRKSTRLNSSHANISYAVFCLKKKKQEPPPTT